jgi:hypothetical protein
MSRKIKAEALRLEEVERVAKRARKHEEFIERMKLRHKCYPDLADAIKTYLRAWFMANKEWTEYELTREHRFRELECLPDADSKHQSAGMNENLLNTVDFKPLPTLKSMCEHQA